MHSFFASFRHDLLRSLGLPGALAALTCAAPLACGDSTGGTTDAETTGGTDTAAGTESSGASESSTTASSGTETGGETTGTSGATTDPTGETDPETTDPTAESSPTDPTGETDPGTTDPTGETDPGTTDPTGETDPGTTDPTGETDPGTTDPTGETETGGLACEDKAPPGHEVETACFPVPDGLQSCDECGPDCQQTNMNGAITQDPDFCWAEQLMVLCGPDDGVPQVPGSCCYTASYNGILCEGRPCIVDGAPRVASLVARADWSDPDIAPAVAGLDATTRAALASAWREDGLMEHASIAAFSRFVLQLMAVAAPAWLVEETQRALDDEIEHARLCFGLGDAYGGDHQGPGPLEVEDLLEETAEITDVAVATVVEGCVAETIAALLARAALERARDPEVRRALARIAEDEARHATLAWRFVQWAIEEGGAPVREAVRAAFATTAARPPAPRSLPADVDAAAMGDHGRLDAAAQIAVIEAGLAEVIGPCAAALVDPASRPARALEILPFPSGQVH